MSDLDLKATASTPAVHASTQEGVLELRGDSYPENSFEFFVPITEWVEGYLAGSKAPLRLNLFLLYLNTSSVKVMMDIFDLFEEAHGDGRDVSVYWYYDQENERIAELAEDFKEDCTFTFEIVKQDSAA